MSQTPPQAEPMQENKLVLAFCLFTALIPFIGIDHAKSYSYLPIMIGAVFFALFSWQKNSAITKPVISKKAAIFVGTILTLSAISLFWSVDFKESQEKVFKLICLLPPQILLISLYASFNRKTLHPYLHIVPYVLILSAGFLCFEIWSHGYIFNTIRGLPTTIPADPDDFNRGSVTLCLYVFCGYAILAQKIKPPIAFALLFIPTGLAVFLSESQSAQLGLLAGLVTFFVFPYRSKTAFKVLTGLMLLLILCAPIFMPPIYDHFATQLQHNSFLARGYAGHRLEIWDYISRYAMKSPLFGYGIEATRTVQDFDSHNIFHEKSTILHPHNFALQIWMEFGLIGIMIATYFMYKLMKIINDQYNPQQKRIILSTLIATLVPASFAYGLWQGLWVGLMFHVAAVTLMTANYMQHDKARS